jgi:hypothetical protein
MKTVWIKERTSYILLQEKLGDLSIKIQRTNREPALGD